jgi:hypothetical protein
MACIASRGSHGGGGGTAIEAVSERFECLRDGRMFSKRGVVAELIYTQNSYSKTNDPSNYHSLIESMSCAEQEVLPTGTQPMRSSRS